MKSLIAFSLLIWLALTTLTLAQYAPSPIILGGNTSGNPPVSSSGNEGNFLLDVSSGKMFQKSFSAWSLFGTLPINSYTATVNGGLSLSSGAFSLGDGVGISYGTPGRLALFGGTGTSPSTNPLLAIGNNGAMTFKKDGTVASPFITFNDNSTTGSLGNWIEFYTEIGNPAVPQLVGYWGDGGGYYTRNGIVDSGHYTGNGGQGSTFLLPTVSDPTMLSIWSDITGPAVQIRNNAGTAGERVLDAMDHSGNYNLSIDPENNQLRLGRSSTYAAQDTFLSWPSAGVIQIGTATGNALGTVSAAIYKAGGIAGLASKTCTINTANAATGITITITGGVITGTTTC
jgi:hypothetical protein